MHNPWEDEPKICWCTKCKSEIDGTVYLNDFGDPYCIGCMVDERETDEDGEFLDEDWETVDAYEYAQEQDVQDYLAYCDMRYEQMRDMGLCNA